MRRNQRTHQNGFTIIEVLMVLAIGGMIALIIFQAIPTLTRNSRNAQRKDSVAAVLRAVSSYRLRNGGTVPPICSGGGCFGAGSFTEYEKLGYYNGADGTSIEVCNGNYVTAPSSLVLKFPGCSALPSAATSTEIVKIYNYQTCSDDTPGDPSYKPGLGTKNSAGYSDVVALFGLERGNGTVQPYCQEL